MAQLKALDQKKKINKKIQLSFVFQVLVACYDIKFSSQILIGGF